jgi:molybdate transport system permease protein
LKLDGLADRYPNQLSGGQGRRVAMARALVRQPAMLLLDEPFTGLDTPVRDELRRVLRTMQRETALTTVLVTHDPAEAALLADEVMLIEDGRVLQAGPTQSVLAHPATPHAARLLGIRNLGTGTITDTGLRAGELHLPLADLPASPGTPVTWCIRPEEVRLGDGGHAATVVDVVALGPVTELTLALAGGGELAATTANGHGVAIGDRAGVVIPPDALTVWPGIIGT